MKIFISADIEGVSGIVRPEQTMLEGKDYTYARNLMIEEVNAAVEGAIEGGAEQVVVCDAHSHQFNLLPDRLHKKALLVTGNFKPVSSMLEGLDRSFNSIFFIGYHARVGSSKAVLSHTYFSKEVQNVRINGMEAGELGINAALAGYYGIPAGLVTGDKAVCEEAKAILDQVETVPVKESFGRYSAICVHPEVARERIRLASQKAVSNLNQRALYSLPKEIVFEIDFTDPAMADVVELIPDFERSGNRQVKTVGSDYLRIYKLFRAGLYLASTVYNKYY